MARRSVDGRKGSSNHNFGQENRGSKSPFKGPSPMETQAPGERANNRPKGPSLGGRGANQSGGGEPCEVVDGASQKDLAKHSGRK